eukprot:1394735-Amorphochlora_amoeboformis.AAC.2
MRLARAALWLVAVGAAAAASPAVSRNALMRSTHYRGAVGSLPRAFGPGIFRKKTGLSRWERRSRQDYGRRFSLAFSGFGWNIALLSGGGTSFGGLTPMNLVGGCFRLNMRQIARATIEEEVSRDPKRDINIANLIVSKGGC